MRSAILSIFLALYCSCVFSLTSATSPGNSEDFVGSNPSRLSHSIVPRLSIKSRGFITRNSWNVINLRAVHNLSSIQVSWNLTPTLADELSCCSSTFLEVYPMDYVERRRVKDEAIQVVMLPFNTSNYQLDTALLQRNLRVKQLRSKITDDEYVELLNSQRYVICIRLWNRLAGKDRIVDESCTTTVIKPSSSTGEPSAILIIFLVIITFNILLILVVVLVARQKQKEAEPEPVLPFTVKKWWKDVSDILHIQQRANMAAQTSLFGNVNGGLSVISSNSNSPSLLNSYVADYAASRPPFCSPNVHRPTRINPVGLVARNQSNFLLPGNHCYYNVPSSNLNYVGQHSAFLDPRYHDHVANENYHRRAASWGGPISVIV